MRLEYYRDHNLFSLILENNSLVVKNLVDENWEVPLFISVETRRIQELMNGVEVVLEHTYRESNKVTDFIANKIFSFASTDRLTYSTFQELSNETRVLLNMYKLHFPNLIIKKIQNGEHHINSRI